MFTDVSSFYKGKTCPHRALQPLQDYVKLIGTDTFRSDDRFILESVLNGGVFLSLQYMTWHVIHFIRGMTLGSCLSKPWSTTVKDDVNIGTCGHGLWMSCFRFLIFDNRSWAFYFPAIPPDTLALEPSAEKVHLIVFLFITYFISHPWCFQPLRESCPSSSVSADCTKWR